MKKVGIVVVVVVLFLVSVGAVYATIGNKNITVTYRNISVYINGEKKVASNEPFIYSNTTYVPLRFIAESLGMQVGWDASSNVINIQPSPGTVLLKSEPVPGAEITVEQYPGPVIVKDIKTTGVSDENGVFSFTIGKDFLASMPEEMDFILTIKPKGTTKYLLKDGASNSFIVRVKKANAPTYSFVVNWNEEVWTKSTLTTNKGSFAVNPKAQS